MFTGAIRTEECYRHLPTNDRCFIIVSKIAVCIGILERSPGTLEHYPAILSPAPKSADFNIKWLHNAQVERVLFLRRNKHISGACSTP